MSAFHCLTEPRPGVFFVTTNKNLAVGQVVGTDTLKIHVVELKRHFNTKRGTLFRQHLARIGPLQSKDLQKAPAKPSFGFDPKCSTLCRELMTSYSAPSSFRYQQVSVTF